MKTKKWIKASMLFMVAALFAACASEDIAQDKKKENGTEAPKGGVIFAANGPKVSAKRLAIDDEDEFAGAKTRTNIKHTPGNGADAYWTSDDYIWVKKQDGTWAKSTAITLHDGGTSAEFTLPGSKTDYADGCEVRYTTAGNFLSYAPVNLVYFPQNQSRTIANDFSRAGEWGDCGSGVAHNTGNPDKFNFTLSHKSSYLCFLPRCTNAALAPNIRLKGIKVTANQATNNASFFPGFHSFNGDDIDYIGTPTIRRSIEITLPDFPLSTTANQAANATYLVVPPDTYDFKIEYTIKDPTTNVETVITDIKTNITLDKGNIYDVTANLMIQRSFNINEYKYYMWDAYQDYWSGHLKGDGSPDGNYPKGKSDPRFYHENPNPYVAQPLAADRSCKDFPNVNEMCWYVMAGDPHWASCIYVNNGHLQKIDGMWIRKKSAIVTYLRANGYPTITETDMKNGYKESPTAPFVDYRNTSRALSNTSVTNSIPTNIADYFFLPVLGYYYSANLDKFGSLGFYWSSSAYPSGYADAYVFWIRSFAIEVGGGYRGNGMIGHVFE